MTDNNTLTPKYTLLKVAYNPNISPDAGEKIKDTLTSSMESHDSESEQFCLGSIIAEKDLELNKKDLALLKAIQEQGIHYIEI